MKAMLTAAMFAALCVSARVEACTGDCSSDGLVTVDEIIQGVNIALGSGALAQCLPFDVDGGGAVTVDEIVAAVTNALNGCRVTPTASPTGTPVQSAATSTPTSASPPSSTPTATPTSTSPPPSTPTATADGTSPPPPTATATVDVVDGVSRQILGLFAGEVRSDFRTLEASFIIRQTGTAEVQVTDIGRFLFNSVFATAETPTRIVYALSDPSIVHSLTLELVAPERLMGTYTEGEGAAMITYTLDLEFVTDAS